MANEYLIQNTTLTAIANAIRGKLGEKGYTINPAYISVGDEDGGVLAEAAAISYVEYVDYTNGSYNGVHADDNSQDTFRWYDYLKDNNDVSTLVLYKTSAGDQAYQDYPDVNEPFFHIGRVELGGVEYDKWRKIEMNPDGQNSFTWDGAQGKKYIYTNVITVAPSDAIGPLDMPAKIMSISGGEDLSAELAAQDELIADIKTAVAGKAGGGGGAALNTCTARITVSGDVEAGLYGCSFTCYENGALQASNASDLSHVLGWSDYLVHNVLCGSAFNIIIDNEYIGLYVDQVHINGETMAITKTITGQYAIISGALPLALNSSEAEIMIVYA